MNESDKYMKTSFVTVRLNNFLFGIDVNFVREINRLMDITSVYLAPNYISGLMNLRGQIITIVDPGIRLNLGKRVITPKSRCVVMKATSGFSSTDKISLNDTVGILADSVGDIVTVDNSTIDQLPPNISELDGEYIDGVVSLENELLMILKIGILLQNETATNKIT